MGEDTETHWRLGEFAARYSEHSISAFLNLFPTPFLLEVFHHGRDTWEDLRLVPVTGSFEIGRREGSFLQLSDTSVSLAQAQIREPRSLSEPWLLRNLAATNRTLVNGEPIAPDAQLKDMDLLTFGDGVRYVFVLAPTFLRVVRCTARPLDEELIAFLEGRGAASSDPVICPGVLARVRCFLHCGPGHSIPLVPGTKLLIGRNGSSNVTLDDKSVSRAHAQFQCGADGATIQDLCSSNGTRVDGVKIGSDPIRILPNQQVKVGPFKLTLDAECPHREPPTDREAEAQPDDERSS